MFITVVEPQPPEGYYYHGFCSESTKKADDEKFVWAVNKPPSVLTRNGVYIASPYQPGQKVYVRETYRIGAWNAQINSFAIDYKAGDYIRQEWLRTPTVYDFEKLHNNCVKYLESELIFPEPGSNTYKWNPGESPLPWRSSATMPKWAARIWLEITGVRVKRIQDISNDDALKLGFEGYDDDFTGGESPYTEAAAWFISKYGKDAYNKNQWVFIHEFKRVS
jgi:hypothetical protein